MKVGDRMVKWHHKTEKGGRITTETKIVNESGDVLAVGEAHLSKNDSFNKNTGRMVSLSRALKNLNLSKEERKEYWDIYRNMTQVPRW